MIERLKERNRSTGGNPFSFNFQPTDMFQIKSNDNQESLIDSKLCALHLPDAHTDVICQGTDGNTAVPKRNLRGSRRCTLALARIKRNNYEEDARIRWILTIRWHNEGS